MKGLLIGLGAGLALNVLVATAARAQDSLRTCGPYRVVEDSVEVGLFEELQVAGIVRLHDVRGRLVRTFADFNLQVWGCQDVTADGVDELLLRRYTGGLGGAHCCWIHAVYSMTQEIENLLIFEAGAVELDSSDFRNLDRTPPLEIFASDDGLRNFGGLSGHYVTTLPLILCYREGRYADCTREFEGLLEGSIRAAGQRLRLRLAAQPAPSDNAPVQWAALELYALHLLKGQESAGREKLRQVLPQNVWLWLEEHRDELIQRVEARARKIRYEP